MGTRTTVSSKASAKKKALPATQLKKKARAEKPQRKGSKTMSLESTSRTRSTSSGAQKKFKLDAGKLRNIHDLMVKARCLEERLIQMYKQSDGYFWLGGPGEEAFQIPLALQAHVGQGLDHDFWHLHYRSSPILTVMGMDPADAMRQMKNTATDPFSGGRNFAAHFTARKWNVVPITSTIETQYATAIGSGIAHRRHGGKGITIVTGGDAGTAEGEFASCLVWASRPQEELPMLIIVTNNQWGISTSAATQHGEKKVADRGTAFGIKNARINGLDVEDSWFAVKDAMEYVRTERKPFLMESMVTRMYGHSSATGANRVESEADPLVLFEKQLKAASILSEKEATEIRERYVTEMREMALKVREEPLPSGDTIYDYVYCGQKGRYW